VFLTSLGLTIQISTTTIIDNADLYDSGQQVSGNQGNQAPSSDLSTSVQPTNHKKWSGWRDSRKRQIEETGMQLKQTVAGLHVVMKRQDHAEAFQSQQANIFDRDM